MGRTLLAAGAWGPLRTLIALGAMRPLALRSVLVATDLDDAMLPALRTAMELARLTDARLFVVHAQAPDSSAADAEGAVTAQLRRAGWSRDAVSDIRIETGAADQVISAAARRSGADVIVLGPHRPDRPSGLGSTATRVVHAAEVPCLILPVALPLPLGAVLAPVDTSEAGLGALRGTLAVALTWASALRRRRPEPAGPTRLLVLSVVPDAPRSANAAGLESLRREVAGVRDRLAAVAGVDVEEAIEHGDDPAAAILRRAEADGSDLVVLGSRGGAVAGAAELGSVSAGVVRGAVRPVLLVPPAVWRGEGGSLASGGGSG